MAMLALPPAPAPARRRTLLAATAFASAAMLMFFGGLIALYIRVRDDAGGSTAAWFPKKVKVPEVPANTILFIMLAAMITAQWAVYSARRANRRDTAVALSLLAVLALAALNAQIFIYKAMGVPSVSAAETRTSFNVMFYTITGAFFAALLVGMVMAAVGAFRSLGGRYRSDDTEAISATALYWYVLSFAFCAIWFFVYVGK
jgi:heme/copper-type cytochrome/quinol oxidase subunit 3